MDSETEDVAQEGTAEFEPKSKSKSLVIAVPLLLVTYVLSIGPVEYLCLACQLEGTPVAKAIRVAYLPLLWLHVWSDGGVISQMLNEWLRFWLSLAHSV